MLFSIGPQVLEILLENGLRLWLFQLLKFRQTVISQSRHLMLGMVLDDEFVKSLWRR